MSQELFEHCWHYRSDVLMVCCHCGTEAYRLVCYVNEIPDGHGSHYPMTGQETQIEVSINGPALCDRAKNNA